MRGHLKGGGGEGWGMGALQHGGNVGGILKDGGERCVVGMKGG